MQTLRLSVLALALLALSALTAHAQVVAGTTLYFDHTVEEQAATETYQLCVGGTDCRDIGVTRIGDTVTLTTTLPSWVPRGRSDYTVRAVWKAPLTGTSGPSNVLSLVVVGGPDRFRITAAADPQ